MRKSSRVLQAITVSLLAALAVPVLAAESVDLQVTQVTPERVLLQYSFGEYDSQVVRIDNEDYSIIRMPGEPVVKEVGAPELPRVCRSVVIPPDSEVSLRVTPGDYREVSMLVVPARGFISRSIDPQTVPYEFGDIYQVDAFYPAELATLGESYVLRSQCGVTVAVQPFQYNPVTGVLRIYTAMTVEVVATRQDIAGAAPDDELDRLQSRTFHGIYESHFVNYNSGRYDPLDEEGDMLIICHDAWLANMAPFVAHKASAGIDATLVGVSTIGNNATAIKNYIQGVYNGGNLAFVLLVGDIDQIASPSASGGASDPSYAKLAGNDDYPDILVGRFSALNAGDVDTQVQRTITYETMPATEQDWFWKGTGVASDLGPGDDGEYDDEHMDNLRDILLAADWTHMDRIYDPSGTSAQVSAALNEGRGMVHYTGHGGPTGWGSSGFSTSNIDALQNVDMLPFVMCVACNNGEFEHYDNVFGEAWLRATYNGQPTGGIGCYASSIGQSWDPPMEAQDEFIDLIADGAEPYHSYGALCFAGSCSMMDDYGSGGVAMFDTWIVFGDPSLRVVGAIGPPHGMKVAPGLGLTAEGEAGGPFTPDSVEYTLTNYNTTPIDYEVTHAVSWIDVTGAAGTIPAEGTATVTVSLNSEVNTFGNGVYEDMINFVNTTDHDGDSTRAVIVKVGSPTRQYEWTLDSNPGWSTSGQWAFGHPTGNGGSSYGYSDPSNGATGTNVFGVNLNGDYSTSPGGPYYLVTGPIDLSNVLSDVTLKFQRWLNSDYEPYAYATIEVSTDGSSWNQIWSMGGTGITENSWSQQVYDISDLAGESTAYIRWGYQVGSGVYAHSGWNIDDIEIWGLAGSPPVIGDIDGDGDVDLSDLSYLLSSYSLCAGDTGFVEEADLDDNGCVELSDLSALLANYGYGL